MKYHNNNVVVVVVVVAPAPGSLAPHAAANTSSSSYTFVQIKREPCQVSEVTTSNNNCHQSLTTTTHHHGLGTIASGSSASSASSSSSLSSASTAATSKTMSSSTLTTLVKIEASSPKVQELDKNHVTNALQTQSAANIVNSSTLGYHLLTYEGKVEICADISEEAYRVLLMIVEVFSILSVKLSIVSRNYKPISNNKSNNNNDKNESIGFRLQLLCKVEQKNSKELKKKKSKKAKKKKRNKQCKQQQQLDFINTRMCIIMKTEGGTVGERIEIMIGVERDLNIRPVRRSCLPRLGN
uniref:Uncharacterized protein n=1 Tax=Glossina austeni TaxID=7395 RepID=A0A1A9VB98_GLOAU